uniref:Uncharacterized protein n=1 Tax=Ascaris lumbricoides TaxID=6252 RepID=A0A0M3HF92_ASCLU
MQTCHFLRVSSRKANESSSPQSRYQPFLRSDDQVPSSAWNRLIPTPVLFALQMLSLMFSYRDFQSSNLHPLSLSNDRFLFDVVPTLSVNR